MNKPATQQYWIQQKHNENWVDNVGFDQSKTLSNALKDLRATQASWRSRRFRLIVRTDAVLSR